MPSAREILPDPFTGYLFRLSLGNILIAGFSECSGLELETSVFEYQEGGLNTHKLKFPDIAGVKNLVLKRGVIHGRHRPLRAGA